MTVVLATEVVAELRRVLLKIKTETVIFVLIRVYQIPVANHFNLKQIED